MSNTNLNRKCWIAAVVTGLLVWLFTAGFGDVALFGGLVLGLITTALFGLFLVWITAGGDHYMDDLGGNGAMQMSSLITQAVAPGADDHQPEPAITAEINAGGNAQLQGDGRQRPGSSRNDIYGKKAPEDAGPKDSGQKTHVAQAKKEDAATPDDLKEIKGVGPKLEELLHENGVTRFAQIAGWSETDIDHFAELIGRMGGRIRSDDWIGQARILASGGETEFSKRVEEGDVYT